MLDALPARKQFGKKPKQSPNPLDSSRPETLCLLLLLTTLNGEIRGQRFARRQACLVRGRSSGIGRATAVVMAREDDAVIMRRRTTAPLTQK